MSSDPVVENSSSEAGPSVPPPEPKSVLYCAICSFPPEYCEFGSSSSKCRTWLQETHPDLYDSIWSKEAIEENMKNMSLKQAQDLEKDAVKKEKKLEKKVEKEKKEKQQSKIVLTKASRTKRKATTSISGLHLFTPPLPALKVVSKGLSSRLATGASVSKSSSNPNQEEIVIQGDVTEIVKDLILKRTKPFDALPEDISEKNVVIEEEKKKKKEEGEEAGGD